MIIVSLLLLLLHGPLLLRGTEPPPHSGIFCIWYGGQPDADRYLEQSYVRGGQIVLQWRDVEPERGKYDFASMDSQLEALARRGLVATLQINGNRKPDWLFDAVPSTPEKLSIQVRDPRGTLMYWHPAHREAYVAMLAALGRHLRSSPRRGVLLGLRMNFNALGTEHLAVPPSYRAAGRWRTPESGTPGPSFTPAAEGEYVRAVVAAHIAHFRGLLRVFVRNGLPDVLAAEYRKDFENGTLSWFHTSSEVEPRTGGTEARYRQFYDFCRSGRTTCYAEPWASAWGHHGGKTDDRWASPPQWFYWRLLFDLHNGVSHIALYASDQRVAMEGVYKVEGVDYQKPGGAYQREFQEAIDFAARYAGYHASPRQSPEAWIAFRENHVVRAANGVPEERRRLQFYNSDYTFLMERLPGDSTTGEGIVNIGPAEQRHGAWARLLPAGKRVRLRLDARFAESLKDGARVRVAYLDDGSGSLLIGAGTARHQVARRGSGRWRTAKFTPPAVALRGGGTIELEAVGAPAYLHMVEVVRGLADPHR